MTLKFPKIYRVYLVPTQVSINNRKLVAKMSSPERIHKYREQWYRHIARTTGANFHVNDVPRYATFTHPGLTPGDIDIYGNPYVMKLVNLCDDAFEFANTVPHHENAPPRGLLNWRKLLRERTIFTAATTVHCSRSAHDLNLAKWPLDVKVSFGGMGSTSFWQCTQVFIPGVTEPMLRKCHKYVCIDSKTRKPIPVPDWFRTSYQGCGDSSIPNIRFDKFARPSKTFVHKLMVVNSETDINNHTNFMSYVKYGLDILHLALRQKSQTRKENQSDSYNIRQELLPQSQSDPSAIKWLTQDIFKQGVKRLEIGFMKESVEGDVVDVHVWQEEDAQFVVKCSVEGMDKSVLSQFVVEFFTPSPHL